MPSRIKVESATFTGVVNGRPRFDFTEGTAPPPWLVQLSRKGKVVGDQFIVGKAALTPGQVVTGVDNG